MERITEFTDISSTESFLKSLINYHNDIADDNNYERINKNYEFIAKMIPYKASIMDIMKKIVIGGNNYDKELLKTYKDSRGYQIMRMRSNETVYKGLPWLYPSKNTIPEVAENEVHPHIYTGIYQATHTALLLGGGVNAYTITKDLRLLVMNSHNMQQLIKEYINKLPVNDQHASYYKTLKSLIKSVYVTADKSLSVDNGMQIMTLLAYITNALGYDGTYADEATTLYKNKEYMLNTNVLAERQPQKKYDWESWEWPSNFIMPIHTFNFNVQDYLKETIGFNVYNFYKKMMIPNVKLNDSFDIGTLNVNNFKSINTKDSPQVCIRGVIDIMKENKLGFLVLQRVEKIFAQEFNSLSIAESLVLFNHTSGLSVISTSKIEVIDSGDDYIMFTHYNHGKCKFLCTELNGNNKIKTLEKLAKLKPNVILGSLNINKYDKGEYKYLSNMGYATNDIDLESTTVSNDVADYILTQLPTTLSTCVALNYHYSNHRLVVGKFY